MYHSALRPQYETSELEQFNINSSTAFYFDITSRNLPEIYSKCDVFYIEPAWGAGLKVFNRRVGSNLKFKTYTKSISNIIESTTKPLFMLIGYIDAKHYPYPSDIVPCIMNGGNSLLYMYNTNREDYSIDFNLVKKDSNIFLTYLAKSNHYNCIGDFQCGYGKIGLEFYKNNKQFIMSDYNKTCINVIKIAIEEKIFYNI